MSAIGGENAGSSRRSKGHLWLLVLLIALQAVIYGLIQQLSARFAFGSDVQQRPIVAVVVLLTVAFVFSMAGLWAALGRPSSRQTLGAIVCGAVLFRWIILFSLPIQEVDMYRYIWDGATLRAGVSPFRYSPKDVLEADVTDDGELAKLTRRRHSDRGLAVALKRVHFAELTTVYPLVSQFVFAAADIVTPRGSSITNRRRILKAFIVGFDLATVLVVAALLTHCGLHVGWLIAYAWSPLLIKEFANSGHLDSIAVFWMALAMLLLAKAVGRERSGGWLGILASVSLGLAVGAKIFPVVLFPLLGFVLLKRFSILVVSGMMLSSVAVSILLIAPMLWGVKDVVGLESMPPPPQLTDKVQQGELSRGGSLGTQSRNQVGVALLNLPAAPEPVAAAPPSGLAAFVSRWQMNDLLFMFVEENVKVSPNRDRVWFSVLPVSVRRALGAAVANVLGRPAGAFEIARIFTGGAFLCLALWFALRAWQESEPAGWLELAFLTLAWFWLLAPTQNPWYWSWPLALIAFAKNRAWLLMGAVVLVYYLRFYFKIHFDDCNVLGTGAIGVEFFDYWVVWLEYVPVLLLLSFNRWRLHGCRVGPAV